MPTDPEPNIEPGSPTGSETFDRETCPPRVSLTIPALDHPPDQPPVIPGYEVSEELARGGMGVVYAASDQKFGREVAIKLLLPHLVEEPEAVARFATESRITGRLEHPAVPPTHDLGTLSDGRPFLVMKLIRGQTLQSQLGRRATPAEDLPRFARVFEQICEAVGFAHARSIVHRDLKPHNVMVGAFGEVQVMDWGLAKEARDTEPETRSQDSGERPHATPPAAFHTPPLDAPTITAPGAVLGTPAYMSPEQARGETARIDARSDVFGLGGILCVILTGKPPFAAPSSLAAAVLASEGDLTATFDRLASCGADAELVRLCQRCLAANPADRPADGQAVATAVAAYRAGIDARLRDAEAEQARAAERRKRRRWQAAAAGVAGLLVLAATGAGWWVDRKATERRVERERAEAERRAEQDREAAQRHFREARAREGVAALLNLSAGLRRQYRFPEARDALVQAGQVLSDGTADDLKPVVARAAEELEFARELDRIRFRKAMWAPAEGILGRKLKPAACAPEYRAAFLARGFDLTTGELAKLAARVREAGIRAELLDALDDWALYEPDAVVRDRLLAVARLADPGPWTDRFRDPAVRKDPAALTQLVKEVDQATISPAIIVCLGSLMRDRGLDWRPLLARAQVAHPDNFDLALALGLAAADGGNYPQALGQFRAARAIRPDNAYALVTTGVLLAIGLEFEQSVLTLRKAVELDPTFPVARVALGAVLVLRGGPEAEQGIKVLQEGARLHREFPHAHYTLGVALILRQQYTPAAAALREAARLDPHLLGVHQYLAQALRGQGDLPGMVDALRKAVRYEPSDQNRQLLAGGLIELGIRNRTAGDFGGALAAFEEAAESDPKNAFALNNQGAIWQARNDLGRAAAFYERAIKVDPTNGLAHFNLAIVSWQRGDRAAAVALFKKAVTLDPKSSTFALGYGRVLIETGDPVAAEPVLREAVRLAPNSAQAHAWLGLARLGTSDLMGAVTMFEEAIRLDPMLADPHNGLGMVRRRQGNPIGAIDEFETAARLAPAWDTPLVNLGDTWLARGNPTAALAAYREAIRRNPHVPRWHALAANALAAGGDPLGAVNFLLKTLADHPAWKNDPINFLRSNAAMHAVVAGLGGGRTPVPIGDRAALRRRALAWLREDLANRRRLLPLSTLRQQLWNCVKDPRLAGVRHPLCLAALPPDEAREWLDLWAEIRSLRDTPTPTAPPPRLVSGK